MEPGVARSRGPRHRGRRGAPSGAGRLLAGASLDRLLELLDRVAQRLLLERGAEEARDPEADLDRLGAGGSGALAGRLEHVGAVHVLHVGALDQVPAPATGRLVLVVERVAD